MVGTNQPGRIRRLFIRAAQAGLSGLVEGTGISRLMALSPDGTTLFPTDSSAEAVYLIDTTSGQVRQVPVGSFPSSIAVLASG